MRTKSVILAYKAMGASEIELDPETGNVIKVKFFEPKTTAPPKPEPSIQERLAEEREKRNPRVDAMQLAENLLMDKNHGIA